MPFPKKPVPNERAMQHHACLQQCRGRSLLQIPPSMGKLNTQLDGIHSDCTSPAYTCKQAMYSHTCCAELFVRDGVCCAYPPVWVPSSAALTAFCQSNYPNALHQATASIPAPAVQNYLQGLWSLLHLPFSVFRLSAFGQSKKPKAVQEAYAC